MTRILSILLLFGILLQTFSKLIIYANYEINKEYITKVFCENKNKPKMHCNGKCHMMKQMKEDEKKESTPVNNLKEKYEIQLFSENKIPFELLIPFKTIKHNSFYFISKSTSHLLSVFHPPTC